MFPLPRIDWYWDFITYAAAFFFLMKEIKYCR